MPDIENVNVNELRKLLIYVLYKLQKDGITTEQLDDCLQEKEGMITSILLLIGSLQNMTFPSCRGPP